MRYVIFDSKRAVKMKTFYISVSLLFSVLSSFTHAESLTGTWKQIDDKTGSSKAIIEIRQEKNDTYTAKIIKITPRPGYTPQEKCVNCPKPYTNKPILGMDILKGLKYVGNNSYSGGTIIDPLTGKLYKTNAKLSKSKNRLTIRGFLGVSALGRSQTWIKEN